MVKTYFCSVGNSKALIVCPNSIFLASAYYAAAALPFFPEPLHKFLYRQLLFMVGAKHEPGTLCWQTYENRIDDLLRH